MALDQDRALAGLSLVSFALPGRQRAGLGVLGPLRMDYARCLAVVDARWRAGFGIPLNPKPRHASEGS